MSNVIPSSSSPVVSTEITTALDVYVPWTRMTVPYGASPEVAPRPPVSTVPDMNTTDNILSSDDDLRLCLRPALRYPCNQRRIRRARRLITARAGGDSHLLARYRSAFNDYLAYVRFTEGTVLSTKSINGYVFGWCEDPDNCHLLVYLSSMINEGPDICGEFEVISADATSYRDEPVYVGNDMPIEDVRAWAVDQPGYEDIWVDRNHRGWIAVGFRSDAAERQTELEAEFPGVGVVAVQVEHGQDELVELQREVFAVMQANGMDPNGSVRVPSGQVSAYVGVLDETTLEPLAEFAGRPLCFKGVDLSDAVIDGPQPRSGDSWRLLAVERTGDSYRTGAATTEDQYAALWAQSGVTAAPPPVDFDNNIVIWFGAVYGSGCEIRMDDVIIYLDRAIVHGEFVVPGNPGSCNSDANPEAYLVAVDRARLPQGPFAIQLGATDPPAGVPEERTLVAVDLSASGSTATDDQIGTDPALFEAVDEGYVIGAGGIVEPGFPASYRLDLDCNFEVIGLSGQQTPQASALLRTPPGRTPATPTARCS